MNLSRRTMLKGAATIGAVGTAPAILAGAGSALTIYDSRIAESRTFARGRTPSLDVATLDQTRWAELRGELATTQRVAGLTGWSDWIVARGLLEERGLRLRLEQRVAAPVSGRAHLFRWDMA
jgi:hypothetical protein